MTRTDTEDFTEQITSIANALVLFFEGITASEMAQTIIDMSESEIHHIVPITLLADQWSNTTVYQNKNNILNVFIKKYSRYASRVQDVSQPMITATNYSTHKPSINLENVDWIMKGLEEIITKHASTFARTAFEESIKQFIVPFAEMETKLSVKRLHEFLFPSQPINTLENMVDNIARGSTSVDPRLVDQNAQRAIQASTAITYKVGDDIDSLVDYLTEIHKLWMPTSKGYLRWRVSKLLPHSVKDKLWAYDPELAGPTEMDDESWSKVLEFLYAVHPKFN